MMKISEIIRELSKLDFRTSFLFSNNSRIRFDDLLYIRVREGKVKAYTVLRPLEINFTNREYDLKDEFGNVCTVDRERIYLYKGQNLKLQKVYDIITQTISLLLISALMGLTKLFPELWEYLLG